MDKGLEGLVTEWRDRYELYGSRRAGVKTCADELDLFVERLKGLEQRMEHDTFIDGPTFKQYEVHKENCAKCELHAILHGEQPPIQGGNDARRGT